MTQTICDYCEKVIPLGVQVPFGKPLNIVGHISVHEEKGKGVGIKDVQLSITLGGWNNQLRDPAPDLCRECLLQILSRPEYKGKA